MARHRGQGLAQLAALTLAACATTGPQGPQSVNWPADLHSNIENTRFEVRSIGGGAPEEGGWRDAGIGKYVAAAGLAGVPPLEIRASPPGYQPKLYTMTDTMREIRFTFLKEDRLADAPAARPAADAQEPDAPAEGTGTRWALVVGISKYQHAGADGLSELLFADADASRFAACLEGLGWPGSHIKTLRNEEATQRNITIALESWLTKAGPEDLIVLYWSGHGFPDPEDPDKVYFACHDTELSIPATGLRMDRVRMALEERRARNVLVFADTCHAGKLITRGEKGMSVVPQIARMEKTGSLPKGWIFMVGADTDRQAIEHSSWSNGAFTHCLLKGLQGAADGYQSAGAADGVITMGELRAYMQTAMPEETQKVLGAAKHPVITTSSGAPDIWALPMSRPAP